MQIIKRDGRKRKFNSEKIKVAIKKAYEDYYKGSTSQFIDEYIFIEPLVLKEIESIETENVDIESIQNIIIKNVKRINMDVAKSYKDYRDKRERVRVLNHYKKMKKEILDKKSDENSNANVDENNFSGKELRITESVTKDMALELLPAELIKRHFNTLVYQHDFSKFAEGMHNCLFPDYISCLDNGFYTRQGDTKPAKKYLSACQLIPVILQLQSMEQFGGAGIANFSIHMVKYLKMSIASKVKEVSEIRDMDIDVPKSIGFKEAKALLGDKYNKAKKLIDKEIIQGNQALITNLVTLQSRSGGQVPFTSVNLWLIDEENS